jgi:hypothetical protein
MSVDDVASVVVIHAGSTKRHEIGRGQELVGFGRRDADRAGVQMAEHTCHGASQCLAHAELVTGIRDGFVAGKLTSAGGVHAEHHESIAHARDNIVRPIPGRGAGTDDS